MSADEECSGACEQRLARLSRLITLLLVRRNRERGTGESDGVVCIYI